MRASYLPEERICMMWTSDFGEGVLFFHFLDSAVDCRRLALRCSRIDGSLIYTSHLVHVPQNSAELPSLVFPRSFPHRAPTS